jgi:hypothetical protein
MLIGSTNTAHAVAFKVHNQTPDLKFRMRVHDRGAWRPWAEMPPGFWAVTAPKVERTEHDVEIEVWVTPAGKSAPEWVAFYRNHHGSRVFTRVLHLYRDGAGNVVMTWYDEPPGCRGQPVRRGDKTDDGCLAKSGWIEDTLKKAAVKIGETALMAVFAGG